MSVSNKDVLKQFEKTLDKEPPEALEVWKKLPMTDDEKHDMLMEQSKSPRVKELYLLIQKLRTYLDEIESDEIDSQPLRRTETVAQ